MMKKYILHIIIFLLLSLCCTSLSAQTDPVIYARHLHGNSLSHADVQADLDLYYSQIENSEFPELESRRRELQQTTPLQTLLSEYVGRGFEVMHDTISLFTLFDYDQTIYPQDEQRSILDKLRVSARKYRSKGLDLFIAYFNACLMDDKTHYAERAEALERVYRQANKWGDKRWAAFAMREIWGMSFYGEQYADSFANLRRLIDALDNVDDEYPLKGLEYVWAGIAHYRFWDYEEAFYYFRKALSYRQPRDGYLGGNYMRAWSYMAAYHHERGNLDSAAYYNRTILASSDARRQYQSNIDFAICNLGKVEMQRGDYDGAIKLLEGGLKYIEQDESSFDFMCGVYISLGECYLANGDLETAAEYIERSRNSIPDHRERDRYKRLCGLYALESNYYTRTGDAYKAAVYLDSTMMAISHYEKLTGQHIILLGEQQLQGAELELKNQQIARQKGLIYTTIAVLALAICAIIIILRLYRRRNAAYKELALKAQKWAMQEELIAMAQPGTNTNANSRNVTTQRDEPDEEDRRIMMLADKEMTLNKAYRNPALTLDMLAERIGIQRHSLSRAIGRVTGNNFYHYVNGYRIKEAVRIISTTSRRELYIIEIPDLVGFAHRSTFSRVFKQFTGLTPLEFQKQNEDKQIEE